MGKIVTIEHFRVPPRWLFVKITDADGNYGWGEASLEGHTQAVEGCVDAWAERYVGLEAEYVAASLTLTSRQAKYTAELDAIVHL
jgi:galactonate dehydratase